MTAGVITGQRRDMVEPWSLDHFGGNIASKISDLLTDVTQESITGPPAQQHDGVDGHVIEVHGHG